MQFTAACSILILNALLFYQNRQFQGCFLPGLLKRDHIGAIEKDDFHRNPVMPSRAQLTIFYNANQACRGGGYLCGTPACLIHLIGNYLFYSGRHDRVTV
jgi:hypothetical protein